jgi:hypothetical protein
MYAKGRGVAWGLANFIALPTVYEAMSQIKEDPVGWAKDKTAIPGYIMDTCFSHSSIRNHNLDVINIMLLITFYHEINRCQLVSRKIIENNQMRWMVWSSQRQLHNCMFCFAVPFPIQYAIFVSW